MKKLRFLSMILAAALVVSALSAAGPLHAKAKVDEDDDEFEWY